MHSSYPDGLHAGVVPVHVNVVGLKRIIADRGLCGIANNTKWNALLDRIRFRQFQKLWVPPQPLQNGRYASNLVHGTENGFTTFLILCLASNHWTWLTFKKWIEAHW